jgi:uncharacterized protein YkwD
LLAACAAALVLAPLGSPAAVAGDCTPGANFRPANAAFADQVIRLVNQHRAALGLRTLKVSPTLTASAVWKARHMATYRYMAHDDPGPPLARSAGDRIVACGYHGGWGENVAAGFLTPASVLAAWLQSPGHRANIENPTYAVTGAGAAVSAGGEPVWAQDFGVADDSASGAPPKKAGDVGIRLQKIRVTQQSGLLAMHARAILTPSLQPLGRGSTGCAASDANGKLRVLLRRFSKGSVTCIWRVSAGPRRIEATVFVSSEARSAHATVAVLAQ